MKAKTFRVSPDGRATKPVPLSQRQQAAIAKKFSERFNPDFTRKCYTQARSRPASPTLPNSAPSKPRSTPPTSQKHSPAPTATRKTDQRYDKFTSKKGEMRLVEREGKKVTPKKKPVSTLP
jgi:hypothetical protein